MKLSAALLPVLALVLALGACASQLDPTSVGAPFTRYLANEYRLLADRTHMGTSDYFERKRLAAASGMIVPPLVPESGDAAVAEAREELLEQLDKGGRDLAPKQAAMAQSSYDCWASGAGPEEGDPGSCSETFWTALLALKKTLGNLPPPVEVIVVTTAPAITNPVNPLPSGTSLAAKTGKKESYLVFFDWNKDKLSAATRATLDSIAADLKDRSDYTAIQVVGHTDSSGTKAQNQALSVRRAEAVKKALIARGLDAARITAEGRGEEELLVKTKDGVREPQNRRAKISTE